MTGHFRLYVRHQLVVPRLSLHQFPKMHSAFPILAWCFRQRHNSVDIFIPDDLFSPQPQQTSPQQGTDTSVVVVSAKEGKVVEVAKGLEDVVVTSVYSKKHKRYWAFLS